MFRAFIPEQVALYGIEAAGEGIQTGKHAATLTAGRVGVLHGSRTMVLADDDGQILEAHSVSAGLDYPGVGPEHAAMRSSARATYLSATDDEAISAAHSVARTEGIYSKGCPVSFSSNRFDAGLAARVSGGLRSAGAVVRATLRLPHRTA